MATGRGPRSGAGNRRLPPADAGRVRPCPGALATAGPAAPADPAPRPVQPPALPGHPAAARRRPLCRGGPAPVFQPAAVDPVAPYPARPAGAGVSGFHAADPAGPAQRRACQPADRRAHPAPSRRRHRFPPDARLPHRRQPAPCRLEGHLAGAPADLARVPGREEPAAGAAAGYRPAHARPRRWPQPFRRRAQCRPAAGLAGPAPGRCGGHGRPWR